MKDNRTLQIMTQVKILEEDYSSELEKSVNSFLESLSPTNKVIKIQYQLFATTYSASNTWTAMVVYEKND
jgi:hypothetical protein